MTDHGFTTRVIAVDGGGTRCRLVFDAAGRRRTVEVGAANVCSNFDAAIAELRTGLELLAGKVGIPVIDLLKVPAYFGLAGVTDQSVADRVHDAIGLPHARVQDDRPAALRGALGELDGAIAHFGTGSFFAMQAHGRVRLAGGWGYRLGDEGSAFWLARKALTATLEAVDGLIDETPLTQRLLVHFETPGAIVTHATEAEPRDVGRLAPWVTEAAAAGDGVGRRIMEFGAAHIASVTARMGWQPGMALCLTGGVGRYYADYLPAPLATALIDPKADPIDGAVDLARAFAAEVANDH